MRQFKQKRDFLLFKQDLLFIILLIILFIIQGNSFGEILFISIVLVSIAFGRTLLMFHKSRFIIEGNLLKWKIINFSDVINITNIKKLEVGKTKYFGRFIATGENGIIIHSRYEKSYITPENNQEMVQALLEINPNIEVIDYTKKQAV